MNIENATYAQLLQLRRTYRKDLNQIENKIAEHRTKQLFVKSQKQKELLQQLNHEFFNFFGGDPFLNQRLMTPVKNMSMRTGALTVCSEPLTSFPLPVKLILVKEERNGEYHGFILSECG